MKKIISTLFYGLSPIYCSHVTYLRHLGTLHQSSLFVCRHLSLSSLLHFCLYLLTRHLPSDHSILCLSRNLEQSISKPFTVSIRLRYVKQVWQLPIKAGWQDVPLASRSLAETFKNNIFLNSLLLLFDDL